MNSTEVSSLAAHNKVKWKGPHRVASVESDYVFVVGNLLTKELKAAHAARLRFYKDKELNVIAELEITTEHSAHGIGRGLILSSA
jgi:hypothetical protein